MRHCKYAMITFLFIVTYVSAKLKSNMMHTVKQLTVGVSCLLISSSANAAMGIPALDGALRANEITYSANAKNFQRLGKGDYSMGGKETSDSPRAMKRRAVATCKKKDILSELHMTEKECYGRTMSGIYFINLTATHLN